MNRKISATLAGIAAGAVVFGVYWLGGGDFVRNADLGATGFFAALFGSLVFSMVATYP